MLKQEQSDLVMNISWFGMLMIAAWNVPVSPVASDVDHEHRSTQDLRTTAPSGANLGCESGFYCLGRHSWV